MQEGLFVKNDIIINASAEEVWDALVNPEKTKQYMFGCEALSDWKRGSKLIWKGQWEGKEMVFVTGKVVDFQPCKYLAYTVFDPNGIIADIPENYLTVTYTLIETNGTTHFAITQGDYHTVAEGERRYQEAYNKGEGWNPILQQIKKVVEAN